MAGNTEMETQARGLRLRAERKLGQLLKAQKEGVGLNKGRPGPGRGKAGSPAVPALLDARPSFAEAGIDKHLADRSRKAERLSEADFEVYASLGKLPPRKRSAADKKRDATKAAKRTVLERLFKDVPVEILEVELAESIKHLASKRKEEQEKNAHAKVMREAEVKATVEGLHGLQRYVGASEELIEVAKQIVKTGFRALSNTDHPDHGGSTERQAALNKANKFLLDLIANPLLIGG